MRLVDKVRARTEAKAQLLNPPADGTQNIIQVPPFPDGSAGAQLNTAGTIYPDAQYATLASNGYTRNELVYACIRERAENLPQSHLRVYPLAGGQAIDSHRLRKLIEQPNPITSEFEFFELSVTYLDLAGNSYWLIVRGRDGLPAELWPIRPDLIRIFPTRNVRIWNYGYVLDPSARTTQEQKIYPIPTGDVIHVKYPNPLDQYFGQPPLRPAARATTLDNAATDFVDTMLRNYAVPGVVITTATEITQEVSDILKRKWRQSFSGMHRGEPAFLQQGMTANALGLTLRDLEFPDLRAVSESRICAALSVPPILVGAKVGLDRSTFTNYGEAKRAFWDEAINSLQRRFRDPVETRLLAEFLGVGRQAVTTRWDNSGVRALEEDETAKWERAVNALARGAITVNDARRLLGFDDVETGDVFLLPAGVTLQGLTRGEGILPASTGSPTPPIVSAAPEAAAMEYAEGLLREMRTGRRLELVATK